MGSSNDRAAAAASVRRDPAPPAGRDDVTSLSYAFPMAFPGGRLGGLQDDPRAGLTPRRAQEAAGSDHSADPRADRPAAVPAPAAPLASPGTPGR